eukprot:TRINITY_DN8023_c0_g1_i2.p1 TRINITY_DN8023_c0_g1~~TRINITY_DN8023_c0_g1_i2.p1  ORF type:complete len:458 (-),score=95.57 TRINITY_DN8023_c0_g1_i2:1282-2655(-)
MDHSRCLARKWSSEDLHFSKFHSWRYSIMPAQDSSFSVGGDLAQRYCSEFVFFIFLVKPLLNTAQCVQASLSIQPGARDRTKDVARRNVMGTCLYLLMAIGTIGVIILKEVSSDTLLAISGEGVLSLGNVGVTIGVLSCTIASWFWKPFHTSPPHVSEVVRPNVRPHRPEEKKKQKERAHRREEARIPRAQPEEKNVDISNYLELKSYESVPVSPTFGKAGTDPGASVWKKSTLEVKNNLDVSFASRETNMDPSKRLRRSWTFASPKDPEIQADPTALNNFLSFIIPSVPDVELEDEYNSDYDSDPATPAPDLLSTEGDSSGILPPSGKGSAKTSQRSSMSNISPQTPERGMELKSPTRAVKARFSQGENPKAQLSPHQEQAESKASALAEDEVDDTSYYSMDTLEKTGGRQLSTDLLHSAQKPAVDYGQQEKTSTKSKPISLDRFVRPKSHRQTSM